MSMKIMKLSTDLFADSGSKLVEPIFISGHGTAYGNTRQLLITLAILNWFDLEFNQCHSADGEDL